MVYNNRDMHGILSLLDRTTMYRLMMYFMLVLLGWAILASTLGLLPYGMWSIAAQTFLFVLLCRLFNEIFARLSGAKVNPESAIITGLILSAIMGPLSLPGDWAWLLVSSGVAMASKYIFAIRKSHLFNPAAFGAFVAGLLGYSASWWIGSMVTLPLVLVGGVIVARKIRRLHLVVVFLAVYTALLAVGTFLVRGAALADAARIFDTVFISSPILFFAFVMLVEPLTSPRTKKLRLYFGMLVAAALFVPQWLRLPAFSLEIALLLGNIFARIISPDFRQTFFLRKKEILSPDVKGFWFEPTKPFSYVPGQYLEYTLAHPGADARGIRRYFTIASAPSEGQLLIATKFAPEKGSTFKKALDEMQTGDEIVASKVSGEFVLPAGADKKLVFIAGGIGITPFRSMAKHLLARGERRDIVLFYAVRTEPDLVFRDLFEEAKRIGMRNVYILSEADKVPPGWAGRTGRLDADMIKAEVFDFRERLFYISGPEPMVEGISKTLREMGVPERQIKRDYFPGYAAESARSKS